MSFSLDVASVVVGRNVFDNRSTSPVFGNAVADMNIGNIGSPIIVQTNASDTSAVRQNQSLAANSVGVTNIFDVNKDGRVNAIDTAIVRQSQLSRIIRFFTAPASLRLSSSRTSQRVADMSVPSLDTGQSLTLLSNHPVLARAIRWSQP